jgi:Rrf2 family protein
VHLLASEEYGLRCLLQVARREELPGAEPLTIQAIGEAEGLGADYAAKLLRALRLGGLVASTRGAAGGYRLARPAPEISVWDAIEVLGGGFFSESFCRCHPGRRARCVHTSDCAIRALWRRLGEAVRAALEQVSLADLCRDEQAMDGWLEVVAATEGIPAWRS